MSQFFGSYPNYPAGHAPPNSNMANEEFREFIYEQFYWPNDDISPEFVQELVEKHEANQLYVDDDKGLYLQATLLVGMQITPMDKLLMLVRRLVVGKNSGRTVNSPAHDHHQVALVARDGTLKAIDSYIPKMCLEPCFAPQSGDFTLHTTNVNAGAWLIPELNQSASRRAVLQPTLEWTSIRDVLDVDDLRIDSILARIEWAEGPWLENGPTERLLYKNLDTSGKHPICVCGQFRNRCCGIKFGYDDSMDKSIEGSSSFAVDLEEDGEELLAPDVEEEVTPILPDVEEEVVPQRSVSSSRSRDSIRHKSRGEESRDKSPRRRSHLREEVAPPPMTEPEFISKYVTLVREITDQQGEMLRQLDLKHDRALQAQAAEQQELRQELARHQAELAQHRSEQRTEMERHRKEFTEYCNEQARQNKHVLRSFERQDQVLDSIQKNNAEIVSIQAQMSETQKALAGGLLSIRSKSLLPKTRPLVTKSTYVHPHHHRPIPPAAVSPY